MTRLFAPMLASLLLASPASAQIQSDCREQGTIGTAVMGEDGTITLNIRLPSGAMTVLAYKKDDPQYRRIYSHLGGIRPGEHKPVAAFC
jgi:hypothetical protein